jgi:hypothetical protein
MANFKSNIFLPDIYAVYWHQLYHLEANQSIVLTGKVPRARYFSFITYSVTGEKLGHINGSSIIADEQGNFELEISNVRSGRYLNYMKATSPYLGVEAGVILYRLYLPQQNSLGAASLPIWRVYQGD